MTSKYCLWCGNTKTDHGPRMSRWHTFQPQPGPKCRVCGSGFNPAKSGREDCCYRHRMDS
jgi:transposase-like protein